MAYREIVDADGTPWTVWDTHPEAVRGLGAAGMREGWLTFESRLERRRLVPAPEGWGDAPDARILEWLASAAPVTVRTGRVFADGGESPPTAARLPGDPRTQVSEDLQAVIERSRETLRNIKRSIDGEPADG
jgi:hypothetical protein